MEGTKRLTLNFGVRYEFNSPQQDPHNEIMGWYPGQQSYEVFPGLPEGSFIPAIRGRRIGA